MKIGLLGGSFNPPHLGHIYISQLAIKKLGLNQVWWIPTAQNPFKEKSIYESYKNRVLKCEILAKSQSKIHIKQFDEIYTQRLISRLQARYKNIEFFWLMGADNLEKFHQWKNFKKLILQIPLIIFAREKFLTKIKKTQSWKFISSTKYKIFYTKNLDISSSKIRKTSNE
jgi:nicotinate-nucleotide adenylyltransferase